MPSDTSSSKISLTNWLKPKKSRQRLRKRGAGAAGPLTSASSTTLASVQTTDTTRYSYERFYSKNAEDVPPIPPLPPIAPLQAHREKYKNLHGRLDTQLGENLDYTTILHSLSLQEGFDSNDQYHIDNVNRPPGEPAVASLSPELWTYIGSLLDPKTAVCLAIASRTLYARLNQGPFFAALNNLPENYEHKLDFLVLLDRYLPYHLLCIPCAKYHRRIRVGQEKLHPSQAQVLHPLFVCPNERNAVKPPPRLRISHGRNLPFTFVQLATRAHRFLPIYGITTESLGRRWKREDWSLTSRYYIHEGRLLMRVIAQCFADPGLTPSGKRLLLYSREDYWPFFSACPHWRDGELMNVCKCALDHIPLPRKTAGLQGVEHKVRDAVRGRVYDPNRAPTQCSKCQPMRRCPLCPTEYLVEVKMTEDTWTPASSSSNTKSRFPGEEVKMNKFRHAIVVTRWSDLGDGTTPFSSIQWAACNGITEEYDSFKRLGRRGISGIFESAFTHDTIPGRRIISMNPDNKRGGEDRNDWY